jgi:hypothetical protein
MRIQRAEDRIVELALSARSDAGYRCRLLGILFEAFGTDRGAVGAGHGGCLLAATLTPDHDLDLGRLLTTSLRDLSLASFRQSHQPSSTGLNDPAIFYWNHGLEAHWIALAPPAAAAGRSFLRRAREGLVRLAPALRLGAQLQRPPAPLAHPQWAAPIHPHPAPRLEVSRGKEMRTRSVMSMGAMMDDMRFAARLEKQ